ncbi:hypothetical protein COLO4_25086 [Corchorus olitorius]|uniref:Uncharacterized protein n=1 Tax=Corchorus olitorius TaxID=93759 RepID=A0A1R3I4W8_9ROSI|nr:hypothetical protein COLO4_25086 [Corchorus olitorius]
MEMQISMFVSLRDSVSSPMEATNQQILPSIPRPTVDSIRSDEVVEEMEEQLCRERGGSEMESLGRELPALAKEERWSGA